MNLMQKLPQKQKLRDLIHAVRQCRTAAQERGLISKESAKIRTAFAKDDAENRQRNVAKLLYIHMLGYPTQFGQMECMKLLSSQYFADKRIGYLGLMLLLDEKQEVLMLATHSLKKDLMHSNQFIVGLALCAIANISSAEIARDSAADVAKLLGSGNAYVRKKAALAAVRIVRKLPELQDNFVPKIRGLLSDSNHGVLITTCSLMLELMDKNAANVDEFRAYVPGLVRVLKAIACSGFSPEYDVYGVMDPFLQVKLLRVLRYLGQNDKDASDQMNDILAQMATNTESERIVGNAILYECVQTIMTIKAEPDLRVLAINILGRFLTNRDNNIRYVALNTLNKVMNLDQKAIQRHRVTIVECLKDPDISIRRRALDLVYSLVNTNNVRTLVREMLTFLLNSDIEFRSDLGAKICLVTEKFAPNRKWHLDTIVRVLSIAGEYIQEDVVSSLVAMIAQNETLHTYAVQKLYLALSKDILKQPLVQAGLWCIGEYSDILMSGQGEKTEGSEPGEEVGIAVSEDDILNLLDQVDKHASTTLLTREFLVTACVKIVDRTKSPSLQAKIEKFLDRFTSDYSLELHERSNEFLNILRVIEDLPSRSKVLGPIPPPPVKEAAAAEVAKSNEAAGSAASASSKGPSRPSPSRDVSPPQSRPEPAPAKAASLLDDMDLLGSGMSSAPPVSAGNDIMAMFGGGAPMPVQAQPVSLAPTSLGGGLGDLLGGGGGSGGGFGGGLGGFGQPEPSQPAQAAMPGAVHSFPDTVVYNKNGVNVTFSFQKNPNNVAHTLINATIVNVTPSLLTDVSFKISVPKYIKFQVATASGDTLGGNGQGKVTVPIKLNNTLHGQKALMMKMRLEYKSNGQPHVEMADVNNFPLGI